MSRRAEQGFTLLEILIATFIFAILATTVFGAFQAVFSTTELVEKGADMHEMGANCLNRMSLDLQAIYLSLPPEYSKPGFDDPPDPYRITGENEYAGTGSFGRLRFASQAHLPMGETPRTGVAEIRYYVDAVQKPEGRTGYVIRRADHLPPYPKQFEPDAGDPILCEQVRGLAFVYYDAENETRESWDSDSEKSDYATPRGIKIVLELAASKREAGEAQAPSLFFETLVKLPVYREEID